MRLILSAVIISSLFLLHACQKNNSTPGPSNSVKFTTSKASYNENGGTVNIAVSLTSANSSDVSVNFTWSQGDTASFNGGDFKILTASPVTIPAGQTSANIQVQIIDDTQIDPTDSIIFTLQSATNTTLGANKTFALSILNNDFTPTNKLQIDLVWEPYPIGSPPTDINGIDLNLYLQDSVVVSNGSVIKNGITVTTSQNTSGFETVFLDATEEDTIYYIAVHYLKGSSNVRYLVTLNGFGNTNLSGGATFASTDVTNATFLGGFTKVSSTFNYTGRKITQQFIKINTKDFPKRKG